MKIEKSSGITPTEQLLAVLGELAFLNLWSFPNLCYADGKEICDLLIIYEDTVIMFSDKSSSLQANENEALAWTRWHRYCIKEGFSSLHRAEKYLKNPTNKIYLDAKCEKLFPGKVNPNSKFIKIVTTAGYKYPLHLDSSMSYQDDSKIGSVGLKNRDGYVHIIDHFSLNKVLKLFGTIEDFKKYISIKENLYRKDKYSAFSEFDFAAYIYHSYWLSGESDGLSVGDLDAPDVEMLVVDGWFEFLLENADFDPKQHEKSSRWDYIIRSIGKQILNDNMDEVLTLNKSYSEQVKALERMAKENRGARVILSDQVNTFFKDKELSNLSPNSYKACILSSPSSENTIYVFFVFGRVKDLPSDPINYQTYQMMKGIALNNLIDKQELEGMKYKYLVGIGLDPPEHNGGSQAIIYKEKYHKGL